MNSINLCPDAEWSGLRRCGCFALLGGTFSWSGRNDGKTHSINFVIREQQSNCMLFCDSQSVANDIGGTINVPPRGRALRSQEFDR